MLKAVSLPDTELQVYDSSTTTSPDTNEPILVFVHGFPLDHSMWRYQLEHFANTCRVIAPDLRGFGQSQAVGDAPLTMDIHADDLALTLDELAIQQPIVLCGLSMGGYVAWQFVRRHRPRVRGLVLCDTKSAPDNETMRRARFALASRVLAEGTRQVGEEMLQKLFAATTRERSPKDVQQTLEVMAAARPVTVAAALKGMAERPDATPWLSEIEVPCCVLCGADDRISTPDEMQAIADALPNARYVEIDDAGHMAPLENSTDVNACIEAFLTEQLT